MIPIEAFEDEEAVGLLQRKNQPVSIHEFAKKAKKIKNKSSFEAFAQKAYFGKSKPSKLIREYLSIKNIPDVDVPQKDIVIRMSKIQSRKNIKKYTEINEELNLFDINKSKKLAQEGFYVLSPNGAKLERALINFMLDTHNKQGYQEHSVPIVANRKCFFGTGAFPNWEKTMYKVEKNNLYLNPTAEIQLTNFFNNETLQKKDLPIKLQAFSHSFRLEQGRKKEPLIVHNEFGKVELLKFCKPQESRNEHLKILADAEEILTRLNLPYRIVQLSVKRLGTAAKRTYDIEAWCPGIQKWLEISSVSNCGDFQTRRMNTKYFDNKTKRESPVHTLHASGTALPRILVCLIENCYSNNKIIVPKQLVNYVGKSVIK